MKIIVKSYANVTVAWGDESSEIVKPGRGNNTRSVANKAHEKRIARDKVTNGYIVPRRRKTRAF